MAEIFQAETVPLAKGVHGVVYDDPDGALVVNYVRASCQGSGDVGRWLDSLPTARTVRMVAVTSERVGGDAGSSWLPVLLDFDAVG